MRPGRSRPHHVLPAQPRPGARHVAGAGPGKRAGARGDRCNRPESLWRGRGWSRSRSHSEWNTSGGEWLAEKHGERGTRTWRKLHLAVNPNSGEILASELTGNEDGDASQVSRLLEQIPGLIASVVADGAYDGEPVRRAMAERQPNRPVTVIIPPRSTAVPSPDAGTTPSQRDQHIQMIQAKVRLGWQKAVGYGRRSRAETTMFRYKAFVSSTIRARSLPAQKTETKINCLVLNRMTSLGMPVSQRIR